MTPIVLDPGVAPDGYVPASAVAIGRRVAQGELRAEAAVQAALDRIAVCEPALHAWEKLDAVHALADARGLDAALAAGAPAGALAGVPLGVKDILDAAGWPTGCGTPIHRGARPAADAACVALAKAAGAVVLGKTVTTELAYFTPGPTANPHDTTRTPGGSSSGSAAAVAAGMVPLAFGTQTAGSVIRPASFCGVFALKPTHGTVSVAGTKAFAPSLDTIGWFARSADDLELMRCALAQAPAAPLAVPSAASLRLGVVRTHEEPLLVAGGMLAWQEAQRVVPASGVAVRPIALPDGWAGLVEAQKVVMAYEAARSLELEWRVHREQLSAALVALLDTGRSIDEALYRHALDLAARARSEIEHLMRDVDALLAPSAPGEAPLGLGATGDPVFNRVWTLLGLPCVNVPGLRGPAGMPVGVQLVGRAGDEQRLLGIAARLHRVLLQG